ncbi:MAG: putative toxin-antitoxin system toxin component, PIN family [Candidatus Nitrospinota bacterium M3_3B_026]
MKAVFDSNVFVSALAIPGGRAEEALRKVMDGHARLLISRPIIHEVLDVLARKFARDGEELARAAVFLSELGEMVHPRRRIKALADDPDNRVLELAVSGEADVIVTGDKAMLGLKSHGGARIITLKEFLESC